MFESKKAQKGHLGVTLDWKSIGREFQTKPLIETLNCQAPNFDILKALRTFKSYNQEKFKALILCRLLMNKLIIFLLFHRRLSTMSSMPFERMMEAAEDFCTSVNLICHDQQYLISI